MFCGPKLTETVRFKRRGYFGSLQRRLAPEKNNYFGVDIEEDVFRGCAMIMRETQLNGQMTQRTDDGQRLTQFSISTRRQEQYQILSNPHISTTLNQP